MAAVPRYVLTVRVQAASHASHLADEPPNNYALTMLAQLAADDPAYLIATDAPSESMHWVLDTIIRVASAL
jgi:hypothetical protein